MKIVGKKSIIKEEVEQRRNQGRAPPIKKGFPILRNSHLDPSSS